MTVKYEIVESEPNNVTVTSCLESISGSPTSPINPIYIQKPSPKPNRTFTENPFNLVEVPVNDPNTEISTDLIRTLLKKKKYDLFKKLESQMAVSLLEKYMINRICTDWLCEKVKGYPSNDQKVVLAKTLCATYPVLQSQVDGGYVSISSI